MIWTYKEVLDIYKTKYKLKIALENKDIIKIEQGYYAFDFNYSEIELIMKKYPQAIFTSKSAYYYLNMTDSVPSKYFLATKQKARKIHDKKIHQVFESDKFYELGVIKKEVNGVSIRVYNNERMLIETIRNQSKMSYDYYKELIKGYREMVDELDMSILADYLENFSHENSLLEKLHKEVF